MRREPEIVCRSTPEAFFLRSELSKNRLLASVTSQHPQLASPHFLIERADDLGRPMIRQKDSCFDLPTRP
jgi:hypothetical protein